MAYRPDGEVIERYGGIETSTNNEAELRAVVEALESLPEKSLLLVRTDSQLVMNCATGVWGRKAKNLWPLWDRYDVAVERHCDVLWEWVRGHSGEPGNERADELAGLGRSLVTP